MSIDLQALVTTALDVAKQIVDFEDVQYVRVLDPTYDSATGTKVDNERKYAVEMFYDQFSAQETDGKIIYPGDKIGYMGGENLPFTPEDGDKIVDSKKVEWNVVSHTTDPAKGLWIFQLRKS